MTEQKKMNIRDAFFHYGIEMGRRFRRNEKEFYLKAAGEFFHSDGWKMQCVNGKTKTGKAENLYVGDVKNADVIIMASYDTPAHNYGNPYYYYPLDGKGSFTSRFLPTYAPAIVSIIIIVYILWAWGSRIDFAASPVLSAVLVLILIIATIAGFLMTGSIGNRINMNYSTSGVVGAMMVAQNLSPQARKHTAIILTDSAGHAGDYLNRMTIKDIDKKDIIILDCLGKGEDILIGSRPQSKKLAAELHDSIEGSSIIPVSDDRLKFSSYSFYPTGAKVCVTTWETHYVENVGSGKDTDVDPDREEVICESISDMLNKRYPAKRMS